MGGPRRSGCAAPAARDLPLFRADVSSFRPGSDHVQASQVHRPAVHRQRHVYDGGGPRLLYRLLARAVAHHGIFGGAFYCRHHPFWVGFLG